MCKHTSSVKCDVDDYLCLGCHQHLRYVIIQTKGIKLVKVEER